MAKLLTPFAVVVAVLAGLCGYLQQSPGVVYYRVSTSVKALYALFTFPHEYVDDFMKSYDIFEQENITGSSRDASNIVNYCQVVNHLCAVGEVENMYIPPVMDLS